MQKLYTTPSFPASFSNVNSFFKSIKENQPSVSKTDVKDFVEKEEVYSLHKKRLQKFNRDRVIVNGIDDTWQVDLIDMQKLQNENEGNRYILTVIDVFSKHAWAKPLKNKTGQITFEAFEQIFTYGRIPKRIQSDAGTEFKNKILLELFKKLGIKYYITYSELKASVVERFNRTLKEKMWRMFTHNRNHRYIDLLDELVASYNKTYHRSIKTTPNLVNFLNENKIWKNLYGFDKSDGIQKEISNIKFNIGDFVRLSRYKKLFDKGYFKNWTDEIFIISHIISNIPPLYKVVDLDNESVFGTFYNEELQKLSPLLFPFDSKILDKIIDHRSTKDNKIQYKVSWIAREEKTWIEPSQSS